MIKKITQGLIKIIQKILMVIFLTVIYFVGFGLTLIFVIIFNRSLLKNPSKGKETFWSEAEEYEADINLCMRQS